MHSVLILILILGVFLRIYDAPALITLNTSGYFYHRASYLAEEGSYLTLDTKNTYGSAYNENYPPFFILASVALFKLSQSNNLLAFMSYYPVLIYLAIAIFGYFALNMVYGRNTGLIFALLFSIVPAAVNATFTGHYTEEATGILLIIGIIYSIGMLEKSMKHLYLGIFFLTSFILTWQTFVMIFAGLFAILFLSWNNKVLLKRLTILIFSSIILAYLASGMLGIDYTPHKVVKETALSFTSNKALDYQIALDRNDLIHTSLGEFFDQYSYFSIFFLLGLLISLSKIKETRYKSLFIMSLIGVLSVGYFLKLRFFALPFILMSSSLGINHFLNPEKINKRILLIFLAIASIFILVSLINFGKESQSPFCYAEFHVPDSGIKAGYPYQFSILIENTGGKPFCDRNFSSSLHAFGGIHIEVENARILGKKITAQTGRSSLSDRDPENNISWFEAKFDCLDSSKKANLTLEILPINNNVKINYRCWIPDECGLGPPEGITEPYKASWRNENCIKRNPAEGQYCKVDVYAGYTEIQEYYCDDYLLSNNTI